MYLCSASADCVSAADRGDHPCDLVGRAAHWQLPALYHGHGDLEHHNHCGRAQRASQGAQYPHYAKMGQYCF